MAMQVHERHKSDNLTERASRSAPMARPSLEHNVLTQKNLRVSLGARANCALLLSAVAMAGCSSKDAVEPIQGSTSSTPVALAVYGVGTVMGSGGVTVVNPGRYAVLPHFAATTDFATGTGRATVPDFPFTIGGLSSVSADIAGEPSDVPSAKLTDVEAFHMRLRQIERDEAPRAEAFMRELRSRPTVNLKVAPTPTQLASRDFNVLSSLTANTYSKVTAKLVYTGDRKSVV